MRKLRKGMEVRVTFWDHFNNASRLGKFVVRGVVAIVGAKAITIDSWSYADKKKQYDTNVERHTLFRAAIQKIEVVTGYEEVEV